MADHTQPDHPSKGAGRAWWPICGFCVVAAGWSAARLFLVSHAGPPDISKVDFHPRMELSQATAFTDQGALVRLFECAEPGESKADKDGSPKGVEHRITTGPSDPRANCHGWVFTGGKYFVDGEDVDAILRDNRYERVEAPRAGDLAVWRDALHLPVHTGIVKAVGQGGFVLVESKWGHTGTYLHEPQHSGYPDNYDYYRSPRNGHLLHIEPAPY